MFLYRLHDANETNKCVENLSALSEVIYMKEQFISKNKITDPEIIYYATVNNLKIAKKYAQIVKERQLGDALKYYNKQIKLLENQLESLKNFIRTSQNKQLSAPYPLPLGSKIIDLESLFTK